MRVRSYSKIELTKIVPLFLDGATEGNSNICNIENRVGAVGFIGVIFPEFIVDKLLPLKLIKVDKATGEPLRDANGFCVSCQPDEPGEFIGKIVRGDPVKDFQGYRDPAATKKKILENVFRKGKKGPIFQMLQQFLKKYSSVLGDLYFRSGDILTMDEFGWLYFKDRSGDTFRCTYIHSHTRTFCLPVSIYYFLNHQPYLWQYSSWA